MLMIFLLSLIYASNSLVLQPQNTSINSTAKNLIDELMKDPKKFVAEVADVDPTALSNIIALLEGLLTTSQDTETDLINKLNEETQKSLQTAELVLDAEQAVTDAEALQTTAEQSLENAKAVVETKQQQLAQRKEDHDEQKAKQDLAQKEHDDVIDSLNNEQEVLINVIRMLKELHFSQYAEVVNVARDKTVTLSSMGWNGVGSRAVDGKTGGGVYDKGFCSHTLDEPSSIVVDLGRSYDIVQMKFTGRVNECNCESQNSNWQVKIGDSPSGNPVCKSDFSFYGGTATELTCDDDEPRSGRYVEMTSDRWMVLCEIEVFAHQCRQEYDVVYWGNDLRNKIVNNPDECASWCSQDNECKYWTFRTTDDTCYLKYSDKDKRMMDNRISGNKVCGGEVKWIQCASEGAICHCNGRVRYGVDDRWSEQAAAGNIECSNSVFGDPAEGIHKSCQCDV